MLKFFDHRATDKPSRGKGLLDDRQEFGFQALMRSHEIKERNFRRIAHILLFILIH